MIGYVLSEGIIPEWQMSYLFHEVLYNLKVRMDATPLHG
jgi:hypothetical protein